MPSELRNVIHARVDAVADESAKDIFDGLNLLRFTTLGTFQKFVYERRRERDWLKQRSTGDAEAPSGVSSPDGSSPDALLSRVLESMADAIAAGIVPAYSMPGYVMAMAKLREVAIREGADKRADEKHEVWKRKATADIKQAIDTKSEGGTKALTREDIYDLVDRTMRGQA